MECVAMLCEVAGPPSDRPLVLFGIEFGRKSAGVVRMEKVGSAAGDKLNENFRRYRRSMGSRLKANVPAEVESIIFAGVCQV